MSKQLKPTKYTPRQTELNWINNTKHVHDLFCSCDDFIKHFLIVLNKFGKAPKPEEEFNNIKCLITGDDTTKDDLGGLDTEELEKIFGENTGNQEEEHPTTSEG